MSAARFLIVADDFTGACDTGLSLVERGLPAFVSLGGNEVYDGSLVIDTASRGLTSEGAAQAVRDRLRTLDLRGFTHLYKKIDSTLRGNLAAETMAMAQSVGATRIVIAPSLPAFGREVVGGILHLHGVPLMKTELASDPLTPLWTDDVCALFNAQGVSPALVQWEDVAGGQFDHAAPVLVCDACSERDLLTIAQGFLRAPGVTLFVGSSGLCGALLDALLPSHTPQPPAFAPPAPHAAALGIVGSISAVTRAQAVYAQDQGAFVVALPLAELLRGASMAPYVQQATEALASGRNTLLLSDATLSREALPAAMAAGAALGLSEVRTASAVGGLLAQAGAAVLRQAAPCGAFLCGGDTAKGVLHCLCATGAQLLFPLAPGVPAMRLCGGEADGLFAITKAGAFGEENVIHQALLACQAQEA